MNATNNSVYLNTGRLTQATDAKSTHFGRSLATSKARSHLTLQYGELLSALAASKKITVLTHLNKSQMSVNSN